MLVLLNAGADICAVPERFDSGETATLDGCIGAVSALMERDTTINVGEIQCSLSAVWIWWMADVRIRPQ